MIPGSLAVMSAAAAGSTFDPATLFAAGEKGAWFDAAAWATTAFQDTAGSTPVTTAGQSIARLNDRSGRGNHVTQATAANRPTLESSSGLFGVLGDGAGDMMSGPSINNVMNSTYWEAFIAFRFNSVSTNSAAPYQNPGFISEIFGYTSIGYGVTAGAIGAGGGSGGTQGIRQSASITSRHVLHARWTGSQLAMSLNGGTETTATASNFNTSGSLQLLTVWDSRYGTVNGRFHEIIITGVAVSSGNRADCINYLKAKWGVA